MNDTEEIHHIAARLATASEVFPIPQPDNFDSAAFVSAENDVINVVVMDRGGVSTREYRAVLQLVAATSSDG